MTKTELLALADALGMWTKTMRLTGQNDGVAEGIDKAAVALREYAATMDAQPEFCCESAWRDAKALTWKQRDLKCGCDHNEYCDKCFPLDFRAGGKWANYKPAPDAQPVATMTLTDKMGAKFEFVSPQSWKPGDKFFLTPVSPDTQKAKT